MTYKNLIKRNNFWKTVSVIRLSKMLANNTSNIENCADDQFKQITEGSVTMQYDKREAVFYNKVQVFNRDMSIEVIKLFSSTFLREKNDEYLKKIATFESLKAKNAENIKFPHAPKSGIDILDALAATGLRSIRYLKEIPNVNSVTINDISSDATAAALENCKRNGVDETKVTINNDDATLLMYSHRDPLKQYDVIDLDPYGSAVPFLDSAVQAVSDGGLLCVTCTDMPVLSGNFPETCYAKYGSAPLKSKFVHEMSLRILLHAIDSNANKYKRFIVPWLSLSVDFYVRVFVRVYESPAEVKKSVLRRGMLSQCTQCHSFHIQNLGKVKYGQKQAKAVSVELNDKVRADELPKVTSGMAFVPASLSIPLKCDECNGNFKFGGPFWMDNLHKQNVVDELLFQVTNSAYPPSTSPRIIGILSLISNELKDVPFFYDLADLASILRCKTPLMQDIQAAIINAGYRVSLFHRNPTSVKTDAPNIVIWDIMRSFCKINPPVGSTHKNSSEIAKAILSKNISIDVNFSVPSSLGELQDRYKGITRFPNNPGKFR